MLLEGPATSSDLTPTVAFTSPNGPFESGTLVFSGAETAPGRATGNTIAVLPFLNLSSEENSYFSDGLSEELLNVLAKIKGLRVAARTSAFSFKDKSTTIGEIGQILNVASVLEGSVRKSGNRVRISVQLIKVIDGYQLWSETYDRTMDDIFAVQDDIAQSVVEEIRVRLLGEKPGERVSRQVVSDVKKAVRGRSDDPEAQRLFMLGRHFLDRTTRGDTTKAIDYFNQGLKIDPEFSLCWADLGRAYSIEAGRGWVAVDDGFARSRKATERALSIEPELAEGHAQLGRILAVHDWDLKGAEVAYRRALELAPGNSVVLDGASILFYKLSRLDDAMELGRQVVSLDPLSAAYWHNYGYTSHAAGYLEESEKAFRRALELAPQRLVSHALLSLVFVDMDRTDEALEIARQEPDEFWRLWSLAIVDASLGRTKESDDALNEILKEHPTGNPFQIAQVYAMRKESDEAFDWLEKAMEERDPGLTHASANPSLRWLHEDPRWSALLTKIGLTYLPAR